MAKSPRNHSETKFRDQIGISSTIQRSVEQSELGRDANRKLREIGQTMNPLDESKLKYRGSAAFHVYTNDVIGQIFIVNQCGETLTNLPEALAQVAVKDFNGTIMQSYGRRRPKLRSGF